MHRLWISLCTDVERKFSPGLNLRVKDLPHCRSKGHHYYSMTYADLIWWRYWRKLEKSVKYLEYTYVLTDLPQMQVYNLTEEKPHYTSEKLGGSVAKYPYADHQVPTLAMLWEFCKDLDAFLGEDDRNFAAVHCKVTFQHARHDIDAWIPSFSCFLFFQL